MLGFRGIGSAAVCGLQGAALFAGTPAIVSVEGQQVMSWRRLSISDALASRGTATISFIDAKLSMAYSPGQDVRVTWNDALIFAGTIDRCEEELSDRNDSGDFRLTNLLCVDYANILDRFHAALIYEEKTLDFIVNDLVNHQTEMFEDGISVGTFPPEIPLIEKAVFNHQKITDCFRQLEEITGLTFHVDYEKRIHWYDQATFTAPFTIGDLGSIRNRSYVRRQDRSQYRNRQTIKAGFDLTDPLVEDIRGDATTVDPSKRNRTFQLAWKVGTVPVIRRFGAGHPPGGTEQRVGIRSLDKDGDLTIPSSTSWKQWFYAIGEKEISQNSKEDEALNPTLTADDRLEVSYQGQFPLAIVEKDDDEIAARKAIEGGSGIYEAVDDDSDINGRDLAREKAKRLLAQFGRIPNYFEFEMDRNVELVPGHLLDVEVAKLGITPARQFMVENIRIDFPDHTIPRVSFTLIDGERFQGWSDFFRKWIQQGKRTVIRESEVLTKTEEHEETVQFSDSLIDSMNNPGARIPGYEEDPYTYAVFNMVTLPNGEGIYSFIIGRSVFGAPLDYLQTPAPQSRTSRARVTGGARQARRGRARYFGPLPSKVLVAS